MVEDIDSTASGGAAVHGSLVPQEIIEQVHDMAEDIQQVKPYGHRVPTAHYHTRTPTGSQWQMEAQPHRLAYVHGHYRCCSDIPMQKRCMYAGERQAVRTWLQPEVMVRPRLAVVRRACWALVGGHPDRGACSDCIEANKLRQLMAGTAEAPFDEAEAATMVACAGAP